MSRAQHKAAQNFFLLDQARCEGDWKLVPELVRKIRKHAPQRACLALTAEAEYAVIEAASLRPGTARPATRRSSKTASPPELVQYLPPLLRAIEDEKTYLEDRFQAQVCLGWIHWFRDEFELATERLPKSFGEDFLQLDGTENRPSGSTRVAAIKAAHIKALSLEKLGKLSDALATYNSALSIVVAGLSTLEKSELRSWIELFLTGFCLVSSQAVKTQLECLSDVEALAAFRTWALFWENRMASTLGGSISESHISRRHVWLEYYTILSGFLEKGMPFPTTALLPRYAETPTRPQQRAELQKVEAKYFQLLHSETRFPKAHERNDEVEGFVTLLTRNWRILCGRSWLEDDLGEGGSDALSRLVLEMLYQSAEKTFHSTAILRQLFAVHLALAEFDLAFKAFDTYLQIVKKGKARVSKTGEHEQSLDDDETVLGTAADCIKAMCQFGSRAGAEKALEIGRYFENWLKSYQERQSSNGQNPETKGTIPESEISPKIIGKTWRAVGIAHAQWARLTYDSGTRDELQLRAIRCFRKALSPDDITPHDTETVFALGIVLAEQRKLAPAIELVRTSLLEPGSAQISACHAGRFARQRALIPMWHLLALLLSARQDFVTAARMCEGAFEQFHDPRNLFGEGELNGTRSEHLKIHEKPSLRNQGLVDEMDEFEKVNVLEIKMTQLALIEVLEGPEIAVNASDELLSLYARLFGDAKSLEKHQAPPVIALAGPPQTSIRSIKGSILSRAGRFVRAPSAVASSIVIEKTEVPSRPKTARSLDNHTPTIHVTNENGSSPQKRQSSLYSLRHSSLRTSNRSQKYHEKLQKRPGSVRRQDIARQTSTSVAKSPDSPVHSTDLPKPTVVDGDAFFTPVVDREEWISDDASPKVPGSPHASSVVSSIKSRSHIARRLQQNQPYERSPKSALSTPVMARDIIAPPFLSTSQFAPMPETRFPVEETRKRRITLLVKVWLQISGFYRRAALYADASGAAEEAYKLVEKLDATITKNNSGNVSLNQTGWGGGKGVGELYADVYAERGYLSLLTSSPYVAMSSFESALERYADHRSAITGLSTILFDIYEGTLAPPPSIPPLVLPGPFRIQNTASNLSGAAVGPSTPSSTSNSSPPTSTSLTLSLRPGPIGLPSLSQPSTTTMDEKAPSHPDALTARERAYALLSSLTKLGTGWNCPEAWYALARAHELSGQEDKAREALWWCVEVEEGRGVRGWDVVAGGRGFVL